MVGDGDQGIGWGTADVDVLQSEDMQGVGGLPKI